MREEVVDLREVRVVRDPCLFAVHCLWGPRGAPWVGTRVETES